MNFKEIEIPVPWGIIAGKTCGDPKNQPVIAFHGYQDNANTFDCLIPLLPRTFYYVSVDIPSHGKSSHFLTKGIPNTVDFVLSVKLIVDYFDRKKYIFMGHSFGGQIMTIFSQTFPEYVEKLICLDSYYTWPIPAERLIPEIRETFDNFNKLHKFDSTTAPTYSFDEAVTKAVNAALIPRIDKTARTIIERSLILVGKDKYKISTAQHLKYITRLSFSVEYQTELLKAYPIQCPHLILGASVFYSRKYRETISLILETLKLNPFFEYVVVKGTHDVHIENPERVAPLISAFLLKIVSKL